MRFMLKSKIHRARVTGADIHYEGSISIDPMLMELANFVEYEQVHVFNVDNGERLITYVIQGERDSGGIVLNGAAARKVCVGDKVIIASFDMISESEVEDHMPTIVLVDENNHPRE